MVLIHTGRKEHKNIVLVLNIKIDRQHDTQIPLNQTSDWYALHRDSILFMLGEEKHITIFILNNDLKMARNLVYKTCCFDSGDCINYCSKLIFCRTISFSCPKKSQREYIILFIPNKLWIKLYFLSSLVKLQPIKSTTSKKSGNVVLKTIQIENYIQCYLDFYSNIPSFIFTQIAFFFFFFFYQQQFILLVLELHINGTV